MKNSEYAEMKAFKAVAELGSFSAAAKALRITPSALSQIIKRLEDNLGSRLFNRTTRSVVLTEIGRRFYQRLRPALDEIEAAFNEVHDQLGALSGTVRLHITTGAADAILQPVLGQFYREYPDIVLDVLVEDSVIDLVADGFDVGIRLDEFIQQDMIAYPLGSQLRMCAAASPQYLEKHGQPETPADLRNHQCLNWRFSGGREVYRWEFYQQGHWFSMAVDGPLITTSRELAVTAACEHHGIVFWTEEKLRPWLEKGELVSILDEFCPLFPGWNLSYPRHRHTSGALQAFIGFMRQAYPLPSGITDESIVAK
ncbi:LysR substrate-binding domain-containing protein [Vibrio mangrovi]|uniref:HTH-type transcriptional regulator DmlR n=1 Tax=Vibrio mangrovi TaxID=474394 RepID=A0A1Y6IYC2_9VIBR|nr:LysR substrate-binding domain-containing protein [Vibrio mangrovi]MDW6005052.1 LysR substrate-binding domain-containing protein [Vibrio mangrovi]SMS01820.1 HTH-type transcriptional regulator DmlR [Vibrio mangrovi]